VGERSDPRINWAGEIFSCGAYSRKKNNVRGLMGPYQSTGLDWPLVQKSTLQGGFESDQQRRPGGTGTSSKKSKKEPIVGRSERGQGGEWEKTEGVQKKLLVKGEAPLRLDSGVRKHGGLMRGKNEDQNKPRGGSFYKKKGKDRENLFNFESGRRKRS